MQLSWKKNSASRILMLTGWATMIALIVATPLTHSPALALAGVAFLCVLIVLIVMRR